ncbi:MAG: hypothetical protein ACYSUQ_06360 [Planctomycetota bacterium]|jgi:hypothetical protein
MTARHDLETLMADLRTARRQRTRGAIPLRKLADLLGSLLRAPPVELQVKLDSLWDYARMLSRPLAAVCAPRRGSSHRPLQELWWLQVLVIVAQGFGTRRAWIVPKKLDPQVPTAGATVQTARDAWDRYVRDRGSTVLGDLINAIGLLLDSVPRGLSLDGRCLVKDGVRIDHELTAKQAVFMRLLIESNGKPVSHHGFQKHGIQRVDLIKTRLLADSRFHFLEDHIASDGGSGYRLIC